jgi:hypothetical protein
LLIAVFMVMPSLIVVSWMSTLYVDPHLYI